MKFRKFLPIFLIGLFCVSLVSAVWIWYSPSTQLTIEESSSEHIGYSEKGIGEIREKVYNGNYIVLSKTGNESLFDVEFEKNGTDTIICLKSNWSEKEVIKTDTSNYTYSVPSTMSFYKTEKLSKQSDISRNLEKANELSLTPNDFEEGDNYTFCYQANPNEDYYLKFGDNSVIVIQDSEWIIDSNLKNVTAEWGTINYTHLNISDDNLVLYTPFDVNGTIQYDWSSANHDGTVSGATWNATGGVNDTGGYYFDGGDEINCGDINEAEGGSSLSVSAWIKTTMEGGAGVVSKIDEDGNSRVWTLYKGSSDTAAFYVASSSQSSWDASIGGSTTIHDGKWHHIVGVYNGTSDLKLYVDGNSEGTISGTEPANLRSNSVGVAIGRYVLSSRFDGNIDEVMIFNRVLTQLEVSQLYNHSYSRFFSTGTQDIYNQSFMNISSGNNRVNVSTQIQNNLDSQVNITVGYYDGSWHETAPQTVVNGVNNSFEISGTSTNLTLNYTLIAGDLIESYYSPIIFGDISYEVWNVEEGDTTPPTYSLNQTNSTVAGQSILFSILYDDDTALENNGQYIFSTNNSGTWVNDSAVNFTATPSWANVTKVLNSTAGLLVGYRWFAFDNAGNVNNTEIFTLTTTSADVDCWTETTGKLTIPPGCQYYTNVIDFMAGT